MLVYKYKKRQEQRDWDLYVVNFSKMDKDTFEPYISLFDRVVSDRPTEDIIKEAMEIQGRIKTQKERG